MLKVSALPQSALPHKDAVIKFSFLRLAASHVSQRIMKSTTMLAAPTVFCCLLLATVPQAFADLNSGEISNVKVINIQPTQVTITWSTVHPGSSWVYFNFFNYGGMLPGRKMGRNDLTTSHSVTLTGLVPYNSLAGSADVGQYAYYVGSQRGDNGTWASHGGPQSNAYFTTLQFQTTPLNTSAPFAVTMVPVGQKNVYPGHDLYVMPTITLLAGGAGSQAASVVVMTDYQVLNSNNNPQGWQVDMLDRLRSYPDGFNPGPGWDGSIYRVLSGPHVNQELGWGGAQANWASAAQMNGDQGAVRVRVPDDAQPGNYTAIVTLQEFQDEGATIPLGPPNVLNWQFRVYPPASFVATPPTNFPEIPGLKIWQARMESARSGGGEYWCTRTSSNAAVQSLEYGTFLGPAYSLEGSFDANSSPDASRQYNYDGGRVYLQIADYTFNTQGMLGYHDPFYKAHWEHCAQMVLYPYDNWLARSQGYYLTEPNQHAFGTGMYYARHHGQTAGDALAVLTDKHGTSDGFYGSLDTRDVRHISYDWDSQIANEASGAHAPWQLAWMAVDVGLANLDMLQQFAINQGSSVQPEWNYHSFNLGLLMEALIAQCELDDEKQRGCDPRIPLEIGKTLRALHDNFYLSDIAALRYNFIDVPMSHIFDDQNSTDVWTDLNNLTAPAAAWYWSLTNDDTMRQFADNLFESTWKDGTTALAPKQFNQVYKWSFDLVRYRSGPNPKATFLPSQNPYEGPESFNLLPLIVNEYKCGPGEEFFCQNANIPVPVVNGNTVTLTWDSIEPSTTEVFYQTSAPPSCPYITGHYITSLSLCVSQYSQHYLADPNGARHHTAVLTGLTGSTLYHYRLYSGRSGGIGAMTPDTTFSTQ